LRLHGPEHECSGRKRNHSVEFLHHDNPPDYFDQNSVQIFFGRVVLASASMQPRFFLLRAITVEVSSCCDDRGHITVAVKFAFRVALCGFCLNANREL
jgi:hypothetical protein